jgi:hypothetical protein
MDNDMRAAAERLLNEATFRDGESDDVESLLSFEHDIVTVAQAVLDAQGREARESGLLKAATDCADILVRIVRPMYSRPSGDQGLNDPFYGECLRAIERYKRTLAAQPATEAAGDG